MTTEEVLQTIRRLHKDLGYPPTRREIAQELEGGVTTVQYHVDKLVEDGRLTRYPRIARGLVVQ